jgi:hypothetical protein
LLALAIMACAEEEKKPVEDSKVEETKADESTDKKQEKRGIHDFGDHHGWSSGGSSHGHGHHEEKTLTIVKKIPVPVPHVKEVHVPHVKEVHVPYHVKVPKPYPVVKHVRKSRLLLLPKRKRLTIEFRLRSHTKSKKS